MEPSARLRELAAERLRLIDESERVRLELADEIRAEAERGVRQRDIVEITGYTREHIRVITRSEPND